MKRLSISLIVAALGFVGCGGGDMSISFEQRASTSSPCDGSCPNESLSVEDVNKILRQAVAATNLLGARGTFAVLDRTGHVLALYQMAGATPTTTINGQIGAVGGLEGIAAPATLAAISKAGTGAYLSSQGNAFSTRTASFIVQENFKPGELNKPGGPLFGVQFSQLLCSDVTNLNSVGPRGLPLGLSADPGGLPLYKNGDLVGGIGVEFDGLYTIDRDVFNYDDLPEERVAVSASTGFEAPSDRIAETIFVGGNALRFSDLRYDNVAPLVEPLPDLDPAGFKAENFYTDGVVRAGAQFGTVASGVVHSVRAGVPSMTLVNGDGGTRFPTISSGALASTEVDAILDSALITASRMRAAIRNPQDNPARVSIWVVDTQGNPLGFTRSQDAPVFGIDVSLQKARTATFFSSADAGQVLSQASGVLGADYAGAYTAFTAGQSLDGSHAFSARAVGNLSRPFFLDGINGNPNGPFSLPYPGAAPGRAWSVFNSGAQLDLVIGGIAAPLGLAGSPNVPGACTSSVFGGRLRNGIQIFAGGIPLYKNGVLVGGLGISGDGIDQDDMIAFYGASRVGLDYAGHVGVGDPVLGFNAPPSIRSDTILLTQPNSRLRYVNCPEAPFAGDNSQNVCEDS